MKKYSKMRKKWKLSHDLFKDHQMWLDCIIL